MSIDNLNRSGSPARLDPRAASNGLAAAAFGCFSRMWSRYGGAVGAAVLAGYFALLLGIDWIRPVENWDTLAYVAAAVRDQFATNAELHAYAYGAMREAVSPEHFAALTEQDGYRQRQFADPEAFASMIGMYEVKWLYVRLLAMLIPVFGPWHAGFAINVGAALLAWSALAWWLSANRILRYAPLVAGLFIVAGAESFMMNSIPDFLTVALMLWGVFCLDRDRPAAGAAFLVLAVLTRPDSLAVVGVLAAAAWFWRDRSKVAIASAFGLSLVAYALIQQGSTHPGWWAHLWFSTYHMQDTLQGFEPDFSLRVYVVAFAWNAVRAMLENSWPGLYVLLLGCWAIFHAAGHRLSERRTMLLAALTVGIAAKFIIFPLHDGRTYKPMLMPAMLIFAVGTVQFLRREQMSGQQEHRLGA